MTLKNNFPAIKEWKWVSFNFTKEENIFLISEYGHLFYIDMSQSNKKRKPYFICFINENKPSKWIKDTKFDQNTGLLVLRDTNSEFFFIRNLEFVEDNQMLIGAKNEQRETNFNVLK